MYFPYLHAMYYKQTYKLCEQFILIQYIFHTSWMEIEKMDKWGEILTYIKQKSIMAN